MSASTKIEWTDATWTPIRARRRDTGKVGVHCERVSEACRNCYAAAFNLRELPNHGTGLDFVRENREKVDIFVDEKILIQPLHWKRPRKIFVCSQTDLFGEFVTDEMIDRVFAVMALCQKHTFQVLTKRPERMMKWFHSSGYLNHDGTDAKRIDDIVLNGIVDVDVEVEQWPLPNVWLGITAEDQAQADARIPLLMRTPAAARFVSIEPMLGQINLKPWLGHCRSCNPEHPDDVLSWVIAGGESGRGARPSHPDWFRSLRDQCQAAGVAFFMKQITDRGKKIPFEQWPTDSQVREFPQ